MRCEWVRERINDYVDGELRRSEELLVRDHLESCPRCEQEAAQLLRLLERVSALPRSIDPPDDLWPSIEHRLHERTPVVSHVRWWMAAAALLLVALTAVVLVRGRFEAPQRTTVEVQHPVAATARGTVLAELASASLSFDDARERLMAVLQARRGVLQPKTMAVVRENLHVIDRAIWQIQAALEQDPNNADLAHQLVASYQQEISLLERATSAPAEL